MPSVDQILNELSKASGQPDNGRDGTLCHRVGPRPLGVKIPELREGQTPGPGPRATPSRCGRPTSMRRLLACLMDDPKQVTDAQMEAAGRPTPASWDICDQCCNNICTPPRASVLPWPGPHAGFRAVKRGRFVLMATLPSTTSRKVDDGVFAAFLPTSSPGVTTRATSSRRPSTGRCVRRGNAVTSSTRKP
ncbi:MAG: hypothetical protein R2838_19945 [Caldilineaceae bacterium]